MVFVEITNIYDTSTAYPVIESLNASTAVPLPDLLHRHIQSRNEDVIAATEQRTEKF